MPYSNREFKESNVNYLNKDFDTFKNNLIEYAKTYFPNSYKDFNETSPGMMLIELSSYVGDVLSYYIDQQYKEMMLPLAQERRNITNISNMLGYITKAILPSYVTITASQFINSSDDINNKVPNYATAVTVDKGLQIQSSLDGDIFFETLEPIDFTVSSSIDSPPEESEFDGDGLVSKYKLTRKVAAISGETKTRDFTIASPQKYLKLTLSEKNVIDIVSVVDMNNENKWYEVDYLAQDKVPIENFYIGNRAEADQDVNSNQLNLPVPYTLQYIKTGKRFITEVNDDNTTSLIFGNGVLRNGQINGADFVNLDSAGITVTGTPDTQSLDLSLDPRDGDSRMTLGETPGNTTLRITYRVGGGIRSNVPVGTLVTATNLSSKYLTGQTTTISVTNNEPSYGGNDQETLEEIRHKTKSFFATQNRCVTKEDYEARVLNLPSKFGGLAKVYAERTGIDALGSATNNMIMNLDLDASTAISSADYDQLVSDIAGAAGNMSDSTLVATLAKVEQFFTDYAELASEIGTSAMSTISLFVLAYDINKNLVTLPTGASGSVTHPLKQNIKEYLSNYRLLTDAINITDGKIINFGVAFNVVAHRSANKGDVKLRCINKIIEYFDIDKMQFRQPIYTSDLEYELMGLEGVRSVNWVELTQDFGNLANGSLPGLQDFDVLYDYTKDDPSGGVGTTGYGWLYPFQDFYISGQGSYVAKGVVLPSTEPAVFELKKPKTNVRGVII